MYVRKPLAVNKSPQSDTWPVSEEEPESCPAVIAIYTVVNTPPKFHVQWSTTFHTEEVLQMT